MQLSLDIPDALAAVLTTAGKDPAHIALEAIAIEGYRNQSLTESEVRCMLGLSTRMQVHTLLAQHGVPLHYTEAPVQQDIEASDKLTAS